MKTATVNVYEMYGTRGEYAADILYRGKLLKQFAGMDLGAIFRGAEVWCTNQGYAIKLNDETGREKNPAKRRKASPKSFSEMTRRQLDDYITGCHNARQYDADFEAACAARNNLPGRALQPRKKNPSKRRPTIAGPASAARGEKLWKAAFEGKTYKGYRIVFYDMQNLYGISAHGTHLSYAPTISAAEKIIDQLDPIDAHLKKNPAKRRKANPIKQKKLAIYSIGTTRARKPGDVASCPYAVEYKTIMSDWIRYACFKVMTEAKTQARNLAARNPTFTVRVVSIK